MKILYDYVCYTQQIGGVSRYHVELIKNLSKGVDTILQPLLSKNVYLQEIGHPCFDLLPFLHSKKKELLYKQLNQWISVYYLKSKEYDVFHTTGMNPYFIGKTNKPIVITVHDLIHEKYPQLIPKADVVRQKRKKELERADAIICISEQTKNDLIQYHNVDESKISVIYHGADQAIIEIKQKPLYDFPYLLFVGGRTTYKNFNRLIEAFSLIDKDIHLVCTGKAFTNEELALISKYKIQNRIHNQFVSDEELNNLYCNALAFIYPSLCEGFGLPILEAFRCGCPCIISDIQCFNEVANDAAIYFNPLNVEDIANKIMSLIFNENQRVIIKAKGYERLKNFTWKKCAELTEEVYMKLL